MEKRDKFFGLYTFAELEMRIGFLFFIALPTLYGDCSPNRSFCEVKVSVCIGDIHVYTHKNISDPRMFKTERIIRHFLTKKGASCTPS